MNSGRVTIAGCVVAVLAAIVMPVPWNPLGTRAMAGKDELLLCVRRTPKEDTEIDIPTNNISVMTTDGHFYASGGPGWASLANARGAYILLRDVSPVADSVGLNKCDRRFRLERKSETEAQILLVFDRAFLRLGQVYRIRGDSVQGGHIRTIGPIYLLVYRMAILGVLLGALAGLRFVVKRKARGVAR